jgi:hypothetical protein
MSVDLRPLLTGFVALSTALSQARLGKPVMYLLADQADPGLPDPMPCSTCSRESRLRGRMLACAAQLRAIGLPAAARGALALEGITAARRAMALAAPGFGVWRQGGRRLWDPRFRPAAGGQVYRLDTALGAPAPHAEHAASYLTQSLRLGPPDDTGVAPISMAPILVVPAVGSVCLSLQCALRDVVVGLLSEGHDHLAAQVASTGGLHPSLLPAPAPIALPIAASG